MCDVGPPLNIHSQPHESCLFYLVSPDATVNVLCSLGRHYLIRAVTVWERDVRHMLASMQYTAK